MQKTIQANKTMTAVVTFLLWLATAAVGIWEIALGRELLFRLIARFSDVNQSQYEAFKQANLAGSLGIMLIIVLAIIWIAVFIGGAEYLYRHVGERRAWRYFAWVIGIELAILVLAWFI
jgi:hypothetical protein